MKTKYFFIALIFACKLYAQKTYIPQVFFNEKQAKNMLNGKATIKGVVFGKKGLLSEKQYNANQEVVLLPYIAYVEETLKLYKAHTKSTIGINEALTKYRKTTTTDTNGAFTFTNLKPGKYLLMTNVNYTEVVSGNEILGKLIYTDGSSSQILGNRVTRQLNYEKLAIDIIEIESEKQVLEHQLMGTMVFNNNTIWSKMFSNANDKCYLENGLLNGTCIGFDENGKMNLKGDWKKGVQTNAGKDFDKNGNEIGEGKITQDDSGEKVSYTSKYNNGNPKVKGSTVNGLIEGPITMYHENGKISAEGVYKKGKNVGSLKSYHENGKLKSVVIYDESGMLNGNAIDYYDTGETRVKYTYKNGKVAGIVSEYFKNGKLKCQDQNNDAGKIDGNSKCFDEKGNVTMHKIYKNGNLTQTIK